MCDCCEKLERLAMSKSATICKITIWHGPGDVEAVQVFAKFWRDSEEFEGRGKTVREAVEQLEKHIAEG